MCCVLDPARHSFAPSCVIMPQSSVRHPLPEFTDALRVSCYQGRMLAVAKEGAVQFFTDSEEPLVLHWGVAMDMERTEWLKPSAELVAAGSTLTDGIAAETPFEVQEWPRCCLRPPVWPDCTHPLTSTGRWRQALDGDEGMQQLRIELPRGCGVMGIPAVLRSEDSSHWWKVVSLTPLPCPPTNCAS